MDVITYKKQTSQTKYIIEAALEYRPPLNISRNFFSEKKVKVAASIQENTVVTSLICYSFRFIFCEELRYINPVFSFF